MGAGNRVKLFAIIDCLSDEHFYNMMDDDDF